MSVLVVAQSSSEIPEGLTNNPIYISLYNCNCNFVIGRNFSVTVFEER